MTSIQEQKLFAERNHDGLCLEFEVVAGQRSLFSVRLMNLFSNEENLKEGRFARFTHEAQQHVITVEGDTTSLMQLRHAMESMVEWIAEHAEGQWSLDPHMSHVHYSKFDFSFSNASTAVAFALCWK